jgi:hypothetical protein
MPWFAGVRRDHHLRRTEFAFYSSSLSLSIRVNFLEFLAPLSPNGAGNRPAVRNSLAVCWSMRCYDREIFDQRPFTPGLIRCKTASWAETVCRTTSSARRRNRPSAYS